MPAVGFLQEGEGKVPAGDWKERMEEGRRPGLKGARKVTWRVVEGEEGACR